MTVILYLANWKKGYSVIKKWIWKSEAEMENL